MRKNLELLFKIPGIFSSVIEYIEKLKRDAERGEFSNIMQAKAWIQMKKNFEEKEMVLPLNVFDDDFTPLNELGSNPTGQKLTGIFVSLPFLPPHLATLPENILLHTIHYTKHRKTFSNSAIFSKLIEELEDLYGNGIILDLKPEDGGERTVFFQLSLVTGDNLGLNSCCGFVESFKATRWCRIRRATNDDCKNMEVQKSELLRNEINYAADLAENNPKTGVKENCVFNKLKNFHIIRNKCVDMMHDVPEGIVNYTLGNIFICLIEIDKVITLEELNDLIVNFPYGKNESNTPKPLSIENRKTPIWINGTTLCTKKIKFKQSAAESLCLVRYLGLIIGHRVPANNQHGNCLSD